MCSDTNLCSTVGSCPFSFTEESERAQNYGCLPTPFDIVEMRVHIGKTWACHSDYTKPCKGALNHMREENIDCKIIDPVLINDTDNWGKYLKKDNIDYVHSHIV
jgi:hypothetical protein